MIYLLFFVYLILFCWLLTKIRFIVSSGLGNRTIIILFLLKILAGIANAWITLYHYQGTDSAFFHIQGIAEYHLLFTEPAKYLSNIFDHNNTTSFTSIFDTTDSFWNNLRSNIIIKLLSIFDIFSGCNYFINSLFYNFLVFFGSISIYKIFIQLFPGKRNIIIVTVFLLPSFIYFTSGIHRDGLIFLALAIVCYNMFQILRCKAFTYIRVIYVLAALLLVFVLRNFVFIALIPALIAWILSEKRTAFIFPSFAAVYILFVIMFFSLKFIHPKLDLPGYVSSRQIAFIEIAKSGASSLNINPLFPDFRSFFNNCPQAMNHAFMRPYLSESFTFLYIPAAIEVFIYELLFLLYIFFPIKNYGKDPFLYFGFFFTVSMYIMIGYTIPILGAIVRYRSIYVPFIICPLISSINIQKLKQAIRLKK